MLFDFQSGSHPVDGLGNVGLGKPVDGFVDFNLRPRESREFSGINQKWESGHFLEESFQVESSLVDELESLGSQNLLRGKLGNGDTRPTLLDLLPKCKEIIISSFALPCSLIVGTSAFVHNVTSSVHRVSAGEFLLINCLNKIICLLEHLFIDFLFSLGLFCVDLTLLLFFDLAFHIITL